VTNRGSAPKLLTFGAEKRLLKVVLARKLFLVIQSRLDEHEGATLPEKTISHSEEWKLFHFLRQSLDVRVFGIREKFTGACHWRHLRDACRAQAERRGTIGCGEFAKLFREVVIGTQLQHLSLIMLMGESS
jgi:hypothetical protein